MPQEDMSAGGIAERRASECFGREEPVVRGASVVSDRGPHQSIPHMGQSKRHCRDDTYANL